MNGLNQLTAAGQTIAVSGRTHRLSPLTLADYGEIENRILAARPDPMVGVGERLAGWPASEQREELGRLFDQAISARQITVEDLDQWWPSADGLCYRFWLMVRKKQPSITLEAALALLGQIGPNDRTELVRRMDACCGWPNRWPHVANASDPSPDPHEALPWHRWAAQLSLAYGWTPQEIGRLTIAQMYLYLGRASQSSGRQRMALAEGVTLCRQRDEARHRWIDRMMEEINHDKQS